jgi:hypothetical protein
MVRRPGLQRTDLPAEMKEGKSAVVCDQGHLWKLGKDKDGVITRDKLTKQWTDWVDYWAVDFDYESRKEIISVPHTAFSDNKLPGVVQPDSELVLFEDQWTGAYIFENEWQSFRTRKNRNLDLVSPRTPTKSRVATPSP